MKRRTLLLGLDGATFSVLSPLMNDGTMPFLRDVASAGASARLRSVIPALTPPAWTSLMTGKSPGHHGVFDFFSKDSRESTAIRFATSKDVKAETLWSMVNRHGMRATVLNFPLMFPPPAIDGYVVPGWMPWRQLRLGCHPADLYQRLKTLPGFNARELAMDMAIEEKAIEGCRLEEYEDWVDLHTRRERNWLEIARHLMREDPCELTAVVFDGVDKLQHLCWRFLDPVYTAEGLTSQEQRVRERCLEYFAKLDRILAEMAEMAGPEATIVVASDHGFGAQTGTFFVNTWLEQQGHLAWARDQAPRTSEEQLLGIRQLARHEYLLDWNRTKAYVPTPSANGIHIVVANGKTANGVQPGEYHRFRDELAAALQRFEDGAGNRVVSRVWTREEAFQGPCMDRAPDLTLELADGGLVSILASETAYKPRPVPAGTHRPDGVFLAKGPDLRSGARHGTLSILDVAPTILYGLDLPIPEDMEGRLPTEIFVPAALEARPSRKGDSSKGTIEQEQPTSAVPAMDEKDEELLLKRLRALGYVE